MFHTLPDFTHNVKAYVRFAREEWVGLIVTSLFAGFILTFNKWGGDTFDVSAGVRALTVMFLFLLFILLVTVLVCKLLALRFGYELHYEPHLVGMMFGLIITVASVGYLPIFLPGGYRLHKPERLYIGHWRGYQRTWEVALICGTFPLLMLLYVFLLNPIYLATQSELVMSFITALSLFAIYACIPLPNVALEYGGRVLDFFRYLRGTTFGLEVFFNSRVWYATLVVFVLLSSVFSWIITVTGGRIGFWLYILTMIVALLVMWAYRKFYDIPGLGGGFR